MVDIGNVVLLMLQATCSGYGKFPSKANILICLRESWMVLEFFSQRQPFDSVHSFLNLLS